MMCSRDLLFFINAFCWLFDPRSSRVDPFITFPMQDTVLAEVHDAIGDHDLGVDKSRDEGASFICLCTFLWRWLFRESESFLLVSRNERYVDERGNPNSLFWKIRWELTMLPAWLRPPPSAVTDAQMRLVNAAMNTTLTGETTTGDLGAGGRATAALLDEFARFPHKADFEALGATQAVTDSRIFNSTHNGVGTAYHTVLRNGKTRVVTLGWEDDPRKNVGLYTAKDGKLQLLDEDWWFAHPVAGAKYKFILDGKVRSPWYDTEEERAVSKHAMAENVDRNPQGATDQFFKEATIAKHEAQYVMPPLLEGELDYDARAGLPEKFLESYGECRLQLWRNLVRGEPAHDTVYVIGADVSAGTGASNSCLTVADQKTGEKVASFVTPHMAPHEFGAFAAAVGWWFKDRYGDPAKIIAESNGGHNQNFLKTLLGLGYSHLFYRRDESRVAAKQTDRPGWQSSPATRRELLEEYQKALHTAKFINRSGASLDECREYVYTDDNDIAHMRSRTAEDPSGARGNHGDRVMADALCCHLLPRQEKAKEDVFEGAPPVGSIAWLVAKDKEDARKKRLWLN
jgi:hypothetical protein